MEHDHPDKPDVVVWTELSKQLVVLKVVKRMKGRA